MLPWNNVIKATDLHYMVFLQRIKLIVAFLYSLSIVKLGFTGVYIFSYFCSKT